MTALRAISLVACLLLAGCVTDGEKLPSVACEAFGPLGYSRQHDTRETVRGIVGHNAVGKKLCPGTGRWKAK